MDQREMLLGYSHLLVQVADDYMTVERAADDPAAASYAADDVPGDGAADGRLSDGQPKEERIAGSAFSRESGRALLLKDRENQIGRAVLGKFMLSTAKHLERLAGEQERDTVVDRRQREKLEKSLRSVGICLHHFYKKENRNGWLEAGMTVSAAGHDYYEVSEVAELLSKVMRRCMLPMPETRPYIHDRKVSLCFQEAVKYQLFGGFAKASKEDEQVSGDNFLLREFGDGTYIAAIADGMGSGEEASRMSENVLGLLERYIEANLDVQDFREACNSFLYMRRDREQSVTVDIMECNQYTGEANFYKNGSCGSYLLQEGIVRKIPASRQAFGIRLHAEKERSTVFLEAGDWIVMMSDGVMDFYQTHEEILGELIRRRRLGPNELATDILGQAVIGQGGRLSDDMTVLAICVCDASDD